MKYRKFKNSEENLSLLGFGAMRLPLKPGAGEKDIDRPVVRQMVDYAIEHGVNYFDTAYIYHEGRSETVLGEMLQRHPRDKYYLADKLPSWSIKTAGDVHSYFEEQLQKCKVDYFDFYLMHNLTARYREMLERTGACEILEQKRREGKIRHLGLSIHDTPDNVKAMLSIHNWDFVQFQINYLDWTLLKSKEQYEYATGLGIPVIVMEPVRGGSLAHPGAKAAALLKKLDEKASPASLALRFAASLENAATVLSGMSTLEQLKENVDTIAGFKPLTGRDKEILQEAAGIYMASGEIPCTGCGYCMDCAFGVDIPRLIALFNEYKKSKVRDAFDAAYITIKRENQAHNCTACRACEKLCPQKIEISAAMSEIADFAKTLGYE